VDRGPVAAIDCGTNSIRLLISDNGLDAGKRDLARRMRIVRLGQGVDRTGRLDPAAIERTRVALEEYRRLIDEFGVKRIRMVATSATRDASNASEFHDMVVQTLGQPAEVISGEEEASLSFAGAVQDLQPGTEYLVVDIGGGSTEFVRGIGDRVEKSLSTDIGCVRMTERHLHSDPPSAQEIQAAVRDIDDAVARGLSHVDGAGAPLVGLAGSVTTVAALALGLDRYDPQRIHHSVLRTADVERVFDRLSTLDHAARAEIPVIHPGRVDVIIAGALILRHIMRAREGSANGDAAEVIVSEHDILDGIAASVH
jgi:exopolyphosphatase/guanosine-5'-triphosphate,3'-diphosphate pyrophosphatase